MLDFSHYTFYLAKLTILSVFYCIPYVLLFFFKALPSNNLDFSTCAEQNNIIITHFTPHAHNIS